jgi:hypothetical protein
MQPIFNPSKQPTHSPSRIPTCQPISQPVERSKKPTSQPSKLPSRQPSKQPIGKPSLQPFRNPTMQPSKQPQKNPSTQPSVQPKMRPSIQPIKAPSTQPSFQPRNHPSRQPTSQPNLHPTTQPIRNPTDQPSRQPNIKPTGQPSTKPSSKNAIKAEIDSTSVDTQTKSLSIIVLFSGISIAFIFLSFACFYGLKKFNFSRRVLPTSIIESHTKISKLFKIYPDSDLRIESHCDDTTISNSDHILNLNEIQKLPKFDIKINGDDEGLSYFKELIDQNFFVCDTLEENVIHNSISNRLELRQAAAVN